MSPRLSDLLLSSQSDERLVSLARAGNDRAFAAIVERYGPELQAMARRLCRDGHGEDIVQQTFLSAFSALRSGSEVRHLRGWLYQIVRNVAGRHQAPACLPLDQATASADTLEDVVLQRALAMSTLSEIARLPARQRQAMVGTALDGRARAELASSMGLSEGAVRQLVHRARTTLRSAVTALTPWPLARWISAMGPDAPGPAELTAGAGAASSGGLALKLGALLASGTLVTGAAVHLQAPASHRGDARASTAAHPRGALARRNASAPVPVSSRAHHGSTSSRSVPATFIQIRARAHSESQRGIVREERHGQSSGRRSEGPAVTGRRDHGAATTRRDPSGGGGRDGGGFSRQNSGTSDRHGQDGEQSSGIRTDGGGGAGQDTHGGTGSDGTAQMASAPIRLDGSGSRHDSGSGDAALSRSGSADGSRSGDSGGTQHD